MLEPHPPVPHKGKGSRATEEQPDLWVVPMLAGACFLPVGAFPEGWGIIKAASNYAPGAQQCCFVAELPKWFNVFLLH